MPTFEEQVLLNQQAIQQLIDDSITIDELDESPNGFEDGDYIAIRKGDLSGTYWVKKEDFLQAVSVIEWRPLTMGFIPTAGINSTNSEIEDHINGLGFTVSENTFRIITVIVKKQNVLYRRRYYFLSNQPGNYGNSNPDGAISINDLYALQDELLDENFTDTFTIDLGDIGSSTIEDYINSNDSLDWDLQANQIYLFTCVIDSVDKKYYYVGSLPKYLGLTPNQPDVTSDDFLDLDSVNQVSGQPLVSQYLNISQLLVTPSNKIIGNLYQVLNAFEDDNVPIGGRALYQYTGSTFDDLRDYILLSIIYDPLPAYEEEYSDIATMIADQGNQQNFEVFLVTDGSADIRVGTICKAAYRYLNTTNSNIDDYELIWIEEGFKRYGNSDIITQDPPIDGRYNDITELIADQNNQEEDWIYLVVDATDDPAVPLGHGFYVYNGTTTGTINDYFLWENPNLSNVPNEHEVIGNLSSSNLNSGVVVLDISLITHFDLEFNNNCIIELHPQPYPPVGKSIVRTLTLRSNNGSTVGIDNAHTQTGVYQTDGSLNIVTVLIYNSALRGLLMHVSYQTPD